MIFLQARTMSRTSIDTQPDAYHRPIKRGLLSGFGDRLRPFLRRVSSRVMGWLGSEPDLVVQYLGMLPKDVEMLNRLLKPVGSQMGLMFSVQGRSGDILVIEQSFAMKLAPAALDALCEQHPVVVIGLDVPLQSSAKGAAQLFRNRQRELTNQLGNLKVVRRTLRRKA